MSDPFFESPRPLVFAHRGGSAVAPENTLAAFDRGVALGADGLELDVRLSRDGVVVVHHDSTLERTTNLRGRVRDWNADELRKADAGYCFGDDHTRPFRGCGYGVPLLREVLSRYRDTRIIIEMKDDSADLGRATIDDVRAADAVARVCLGSFALGPLNTVRSLAPEIATSASREEVRWALYRSWVGLRTRRALYGGFQVPEAAGMTRIVSPRFITAAHDRNLRVQVWTVDSEADATRLLEWGVDGLITDRPDVIVPLCKSRRSTM